MSYRVTKPNPTIDSEVILRKKTPQGPRHTSMAIPLPSWNVGTSTENALDVSSRSIAVSSRSIVLTNCNGYPPLGKQA